MNSKEVILTEYALSLGSNEGHRMQNLRDARTALEAVPIIQITDCAPVYETEPVDVKPEYMDQLYLNTVILILTSLSPYEVKDICQTIELQYGRNRTEDRNAPRPIDIDIIYAGQLSVNTEELTIPHPRWPARRFVVQPLSDLRPGLRLPGSRDTVKAILENLPGKPDVVLFRENW